MCTVFIFYIMKYHDELLICLWLKNIELVLKLWIDEYNYINIVRYYWPLLLG